MADPGKVAEIRGLLVQWSRAVVGDIGTDGIYLFGSLVYREGIQFIESSDVDLVVLFPGAANDALARRNWLEQLFRHKLNLEKQLAATLEKRDPRDPICSVVVATNAEISADIHKDGAEGFFASNCFINLLEGTAIDKLPGAGERPIDDRLIKQCFRFAQKKRNAFLAVSADGTTSFPSFDGVDPIPKDVMRHAAMAARLRNTAAPPGAEYDTQAGIDFLSHYLYDVRDRAEEYKQLHHWQSVRRGARGQIGPLQPIDAIFMAEIVWDLAQEALRSRKVRQAEYDVEADAGFNSEHSTVFFSERFAQAFPGVREITWFEDSDQIKMRLLKLLEAPTVLRHTRPMWWWRGEDGALSIREFKSLGGRDFLMDVYELKIRRVAAVNTGAYSRCFVYVEIESMPPTGLYKDPEKSAARAGARQGYSSEEYGLVDGGQLVTRAEHDDGAATIGGQLVDIRGRNELRVRYLTPFNFVIAAHGSPINNHEFDEYLTDILNAMLRGEDRLQDLARAIHRLPRGDAFEDMR